MIRFIDAHTHVQFPLYDADRTAVILRAQATGVAMVNVGTARGTSEAAVAFAEANPDAYAAVGVHPSHARLSASSAAEGFWDVGELGASDEAKRLAREGERFDEQFYRQLAAHPKVVAVGECGLDYHRLGRDPANGGNQLSDESEAVKTAQRDLFLSQVQLAFEVGKPLMIHCRDAIFDLIQLLITNHSLLTHDNPGIMHFFTGTVDEARTLANLGFSFTFGGVTTFTREYDEVIRSLPADRILSETDAPYVAPEPYRGKRNEPAYVVEVAKKIAEIRGVDPEQFRVQILQNAERVFGISLA
ncbi:MAG: TatD family hydrolase [bacterium]|nr:TatD family hydrolase [bacterium]